MSEFEKCLEEEIDKQFPKGDNSRGKALVLLAVAQLEINKYKQADKINEIKKQTAEKILNKLINDLEEGEGLTPNDKMWIQNLILKYNKLKKEFGVEL